MTQDQFDNLVSVQDNITGDLLIIALNNTLLETAKAKTSITQWLDATKDIYSNFPDIQELEDCDILEDLERFGYVIIED